MSDELEKKEPGLEERFAKIEQADVAAIKNKDGTYSFVLGYIIAE